MKWLFGILVALNIIVFSVMLATRLNHNNALSLQSANTSHPPKSAVPETPAKVVISPKETATKAKETPTRQARETSTRDTKAKEKAAKETKVAPSVQVAAKPLNCSATAVLPEDDYHRIKGLLIAYPHAATRFVDDVPQNANNANNTSDQLHYTVSVAGSPSLKNALQLAGFKAEPQGSRFILGVFNDESAAQNLLNKARDSGFTQTVIIRSSGKAPDIVQNPSKMRVVFLNVDNKIAAQIKKIIGAYGTLNRSACKK